jgi:transcriptional regulator with XRE-family HTH domain
MKTKQGNIEVRIPTADGTGVSEVLQIAVPMKWDEELNEWLLTEEAHRTIEDTKARHMGLLLPAQLGELRKRYVYTQKQMGELFQVGEKSWNRWESGKHRPSRSINLLIRALYEGAISINYLLKRAGKSAEDKDWVPSVAASWEYIQRAVLAALAVENANQDSVSRNVFYSCKAHHEGWMISNVPRQPGRQQAAALGLRNVIRMDKYFMKSEARPDPFGERVRNITVG